MHPRLGAFRAALLTGWIALSAAGFLYARQKNISLWPAVPIIAAFLVEYSFYLVPGFEPARQWLTDRLSRPWLAVLIAASGALPYLVYSVPTGLFSWSAFFLLCAIVALVSSWYVALGPSIIADSLFLILLAAIYLSRPFDHIYTSSAVKGLSILGHLMLIHTGALATLALRAGEPLSLGFLPSQKEAIAGVQYFFYFLPLGFPLVMWLGVAHLTFSAGILLWKALATFFGALWVVALSEEFFFRGMLQHWLEQWTRKPWLALTVASIVYGASHLWVRAFPNWRMALVDSFLGCFCGLAFRKAGSIRASMVTHALVVTLWRTLFVS